MTTTPDGLLDAFWAYERALGDDDLAAMDRLFADGPDTLRGDGSGLLVGHGQISAFRRVRGGAPAREIAEVRVHSVDADTALVTAVTAPRRGGRGLQTQLWRRAGGAWAVVAAHVSSPPTTFDRSVWRTVGDPLVDATGTGPLDGETVAVKDLFAVRGFAVGAGVPAFRAAAPVATEHAAVVAALLGAGASVRGIAQTDQLAYSLAGDNPHAGTPVNAVVPAALPGGSSSGSATAVALGDATIGLATDTAGSVRVPASYQGLWALRTTHGSVDSRGMLPLAPDFDTVGLLTRSPELLGRAAAVVLGPGGTEVGPDHVGLAESGLEDELDAVADAFRVHQGFQAWQVHGAWITAHPGSLAGSAAERFRAAARITRAEDAAARRTLDAARARWDDRLGSSVLSLPSAATAAPRSWAPPAEVDRARRATFRLTCVAGVTGRPVVAAPGAQTAEGPIGTSFVGPRFSDRALLAWVARRQVGCE